MIWQLWFLILTGPFLAIVPVVAAAAPQIPGFFGRPRRRLSARARVVRTMPGWAVA